MVGAWGLALRCATVTDSQRSMTTLQPRREVAAQHGAAQRKGRLCATCSSLESNIASTDRCSGVTTRTLSVAVTVIAAVATVAAESQAVL